MPHHNSFDRLDILETVQITNFITQRVVHYDNIFHDNYLGFPVLSNSEKIVSVTKSNLRAYPGFCFSRVYRITFFCKVTYLKQT